MRTQDQYIIDLLKDIYPKELTLVALAELAGFSRTYLAKHVETLAEEGVLATRRTENDLYIRFVKE